MKIDFEKGDGLVPAIVQDELDWSHFSADLVKHFGPKVKRVEMC